MKATLYKTLSNEHTTVVVQAGQTVQEAFPAIDLENAVIVINGKIEKQTYKLKENDIIMIRQTPQGTTTAILISIAVLVLPVAVALGETAYNAKVAAQKAQQELEKIKKTTNKSDIDNRPFLRGSSNTVATGNSQPYIIGRHLFTPYLLCNPFYKLSGTDGQDQYIYSVLECGFNKQILKSISIDDIKIKSFTDTTPQEGVYSIDSGIFAEDGQIEIAQDGALLSELTELNYKVDSTSCNEQIPHDSDVKAGTETYLTYTLNSYAKDVDVAISFPYGLYTLDDNGDAIATQTNIVPEYSLDGGTTWTSFTFDNNGTQTNTFNRNISSKELRFTAHKDFALSDYQTLQENGQSAIYIRVRNEGNSDSSSIKNDCYVLYYQSTCFDPDKSTSELVPCKIVEDRERAFCTILGLKLKATKNNEDKLKKINIITQGIARTWDGTKWSDTKTQTRNPASWLLEIETSDSHPASKYDDSELDLESLGDFYEYCENKGYKFDYAITQNTKKDDILNYILEATGACLYYDIYGRRAVAIDRAQENALAVYNPQNIISIQNKKTFSRQTDGLRIKYISSKDDLYQEETYLVMREGRTLDQDSVIKDLNVTGITTYEHIVKYARRLMAIEVLRPKTTTIQTGNEGIFYTPYSKVLIQDDSLKIGIGKGFTINKCVWENTLLTKIYTNEPLTFETSKTYGIIVNCYTSDGIKTVPLKVRGEGTTTELTVTTEIQTNAEAKPEAGNILSFGELDDNGEFSHVSTEYLISNIKRNDYGFTLELVNYDEAIYDSGEIPEYKSNITQKKISSANTIPLDTITNAEATQLVNGQVSSVKTQITSLSQKVSEITKTTAIYDGAITDTANIVAEPSENEFFTWTGKGGTSFNGLTLQQACVYVYSNGQWVLDTDDSHNMTALSDICSVVNISENTTAVALVSRLIATDAFIENLSTQKILFNKYVGSVNTQKENSQLVYMGLDPTDETSTDYEFGIKRYTGYEYEPLLETEIENSSYLHMMINGYVNAKLGYKSQNLSQLKLKKNTDDFVNKISFYKKIDGSVLTLYSTDKKPYIPIYLSKSISSHYLWVEYNGYYYTETVIGDSKATRVFQAPGNTYFADVAKTLFDNEFLIASIESRQNEFGYHNSVYTALEGNFALILVDTGLNEDETERNFLFHLDLIEPTSYNAYTTNITSSQSFSFPLSTLKNNNVRIYSFSENSPYILLAEHCAYYYITSPLTNDATWTKADIVLDYISFDEQGNRFIGVYDKIIYESVDGIHFSQIGELPKVYDYHSQIIYAYGKYICIYLGDDNFYYISSSVNLLSWEVNKLDLSYFAKTERHSPFFIYSDKQWFLSLATQSTSDDTESYGLYSFEQSDLLEIFYGELQKYVDLKGDQTINGAKTFSTAIAIPTTEPSTKTDGMIWVV